MPQVNRNALLPYTTDKMFELVNDVTNYPLFVPKCTGTTIVSESTELVVATLKLNMGPMVSSFTTRNKIVYGKSVCMTLENGPFRYLEGLWSFTALGEEGCKITLSLDFEFSNQLVGVAFNGIFKRTTEDMFEAFITRANEVCGE